MRPTREGNSIDHGSLIKFLAAYETKLAKRELHNEAHVISLLIDFFEQDYNPKSPLTSQKVLGL
jgi:hypothetical protein